MDYMVKGLTVPKWVLIVWPKIPQMPQNLFAQFVCPSPKLLDFNEKILHWASVVREVKERNRDSVCILSLNLCEIYFNGLCDLAKTDNIVFCQSPPLTDFTKESKALGFYHFQGDNIILCINIFLTFLSAMIPF
jgi:hypothetical protein